MKYELGTKVVKTKYFTTNLFIKGMVKKESALSSINGEISLLEGTCWVSIADGAKASDEELRAFCAENFRDETVAFNRIKGIINPSAFSYQF